MEPQSSSDVLFRYPDTLEPVLYIGRHRSTVGSEGGMHPHSHPVGLEVCYLERGEMEWWTGTETHELRPHDVLVTSQHVPHGSADSALSPCDYYWVHLNAKLLPAALRDVIRRRGFAGLHRSRPDIGAMVGSLFREHAARDSLTAEACKSLSSLLVASLARDAPKGDGAQVSDLVAKAQRLMLEEEVESVEEVAERLSVSSVWLTKRFRKEVGQPPAAWLRYRKLAEAKRMLRVGDRPVGDIAVGLGFASSQYFSTAFRHETGFSPSQYRAMHATGTQS